MHVSAGAHERKAQSHYFWKVIQMKTQNQGQQANIFNGASTPNVGGESTFVAPTSFQHITLTSGHSCAQPREAVATEAAAKMSQLIAECLANGGWTALDYFGSASPFHVTVSGRTLLAELCLPCNSVQVPMPVIRVGVAVDPSTGAEAWNHLRSCAARVGNVTSVSPPTQPWIAVVLDSSLTSSIRGMDDLMTYLAMMALGGDFERCLAWGFVKWLESASSPVVRARH